MNAIRTVLPIAQKVLPLLDGNFGTAIANLLAPRPHPQPPPQPKIDLAPIAHSLTELQSQHLALRDQLVEQNRSLIEQNTSLKRVEDRLEAVREATDRNTLEQRELLEDLDAFRKKIRWGAALGIGLLAVGFVLELLMFLHLLHVQM